MSSSDSYQSEFQPARSSKKRRINRARKEPLTPEGLLERTRLELAADIGTAVLIQERVSDASPEEILCLGLGSVFQSRDSRAQLVFLQLLCDNLRIATRKVTIFDPVFSSEDKDLLGTTLGFSIKDGGHLLRTRTVAYMPHCDMTLYESVLRANWSRDRLVLMVLIANNLTDYTDRIPLQRLTKECPCVSRLAPYLESRSVPISQSHCNAFNNISIQCVGTGLPPVEDREFWSFDSEQ